MMKKKGLKPISSEGGHADFGARIDKDWELLQFLKELKQEQGDNSDGMKSYNNQQIIHNTMFWSQNLDWEDAHKPELFYQAQWLPWNPVEVQDEWNGCKYENAQVIHWHSSRHSPTKLECMRQINEALGVPLVTELK